MTVSSLPRTESGSVLMKADVAMDKAKANQGSAFAFFDESLNKATEIRVAVESRPSTVMEQSTACLRMSERAKLGLQRVAINISSQQFSRAGFADSLLQELARVDLKANRLELELTESVFINDAEQIVSELVKLRTAGVHVALDDFGTGYSSLNMLRSLPLDTIKIDRSFITPLTSSNEARDLAIKIVEIARLLKLEIVAEGVEEQPEVDLLRDIGCDLVQGYFVSRALPLDQLEQFLEAQRGAAGFADVVTLRGR